jgi:hypothetical protein
MPSGLKRYQTQGHDHFITFSCSPPPKHQATLLTPSEPDEMLLTIPQQHLDSSRPTVP